MSKFCSAALATLIALGIFCGLIGIAHESRLISDQLVTVHMLVETGFQPADSSQSLEKISESTSDLLIKQSVHTAQSLPAVSTVQQAALAVGVDAVEQRYIPAAALSQRPQLLEDIDSTWYLPGITLPAVTAVLLINEYGDVDAVLLEATSLSPMLREDLRARFLAARFSPGWRDGRPVKSMLHITIALE